MRAWHDMKGRLSDTDKLGMTAEVLERGNAVVSFANGKIRLRVALKPMWWDQVNTAQNVERLGALFSERLGTPTPLEFERIDPPQNSPQSSGGRSVYDEDVVKLAQRELDSRPMSS